MWGLIHAMLYIPLFLRGKNRQYTTSIVAEGSLFPSIKELYQMGSTFFFTMIAWVFFRSGSVSDAFGYLSGILTNFALPSSNRSGVIFVILIMLFDWKIRRSERVIFSFNKIISPAKLNNLLKYFFYYALILSILWFMNDDQEFIYFQF